MEQVLDWLNENENRAYPLEDTPTKLLTLSNPSWTFNLPDSFILDLQLKSSVGLAYKDADFGVLPVAIMLTSIKYTSASVVVVTFGTAIDTIATFTIPSASTATYPVYLRNSDGNLAVFGYGVLDLVNSAPPPDETIVANIAVEQSTCVQFNDAWLGVSSIRTAPEKAADQSSDYHPQLPLVSVQPSAHLTGDVKFLEGYNFRVNIASNLIDLEIGAGYGLKMNCTTSFLDPKYLDCSELVSYINGVPPDSLGNFKINPGSNINITSGNALALFNDPQAEAANTHTLFVGLTFQATDLCAPVNITPTLV